MIDESVNANMLALCAIRPFSAFSEGELRLVAQHVRTQSYEPGACLIETGRAAERLFIRACGEALAGENIAPAVFDAPSVLFGAPARCDYVAGPAGVKVLLLAKPHLFTIARECPDFIVELADELRRS